MLDISKCPPTGMYKMTDAEYFAVPALSNSLISTMFKSPALFKYTIEHGFQGMSDAMDFGSLYHCHMLTPELVAESFNIIDADSRRGKIWTDAKSMREKTGIVPMMQKQLDKCEEMRKQIMTHRTARVLLNHPASQFEIAMFWTEEMNGLTIPCKAKLDIWNPELFMAADLKKTRDASDKFSRSIADYGYHRQAAWYSRGVRAVLGLSPKTFAFICQEDEPPYQAAAYEIAQDDQVQALRELKWALVEISRRVQESDWPQNYNNEIEPLDMPRWAKKEIA